MQFRGSALPAESIYRDLACLQPIENIEVGSPHFQEFALTRSRANSSKEFHFEEWRPRTSKRATCITYKLTDGQQVNTGYGRTSRPLGYVMEIAEGRWMARVRNLRSDPLPLGAAKKSAIELYRSRDKGQPRDWIHELNNLVAYLKDEETKPKLNVKALRCPLVDLVGLESEQLAHVVGVECGGATTLPSLETSWDRSCLADRAMVRLNAGPKRCR
jgi:hypothetical protein